MEILQNLDQGYLQAGYLESIFDATDQANGIKFGTNILEQPTDERYRADR
jgi:hypothetical protein